MKRGSLLSPGPLVQLGPTLYATEAAYHREPCCSFVKKYTDDLLTYIDRIEKELKIKGHRFVLKALHKNLNGCLIMQNHTVYIDPRRPLNNIIFALCHESLHLRQYQDKRLGWKKETGNITWEGKVYMHHEKPTLWRTLPWEVEVFAEERKLYKKITGKSRVPNGIYS